VISATYENGVLTVSIPLAEGAKPRLIDVAHGAAPHVIEGQVVQSPTETA
jgi:HSP20 family protein